MINHALRSHDDSGTVLIEPRLHNADGLLHVIVRELRIDQVWPWSLVCLRSAPGAKFQP